MIGKEGLNLWPVQQKNSPRQPRGPRPCEHEIGRLPAAPLVQGGMQDSERAERIHAPADGVRDGYSVMDMIRDDKMKVKDKVYHLKLL